MGRRHILAAAIAAFAWAAPEGRAEAQDAPAATGQPAYSLEVDSDDPSLSFDTLAAQLAGDLNAPIAPAGPVRGQVAFAVHYRVARRELTVRADHGAGRVLERTVTATGNEGDVLREAALLASNLARDEARELLDALAPAPAPAPEVATAPAAAAPPVAAQPMYQATLALAYPLATNIGHPDVGSHFDFSLIYGQVGHVAGTQIGTIAAFAGRGVDGVQVTTAVGAVNGDMSGVQVSGIVSAVHGKADGVQAAGATNIASNDVTGVQVSGGFNLAHQKLKGVQVSGGANVTRSLDGVQVAAGANVARDVDGLQVGVVNVAKRVKGMQVGLINIADDVDGQQLGLVSISRNSVHPLAWGSNLAYTNAGFKFTGKYIYTVAAMTFGTFETGFKHVGVTGALGTRFATIVPKLTAEAEVDLTSINLSKDGNNNNLWLTPRVQVGYSVHHRVRFFAGVGSRLALIVSDGRKVVRPEVLGGVEF